MLAGLALVYRFGFGFVEGGICLGDRLGSFAVALAPAVATTITYQEL